MFDERGSSEYPGKHLSEQERGQTPNLTRHMTSNAGIFEKKNHEHFSTLEIVYYYGGLKR